MEARERTRAGSAADEEATRPFPLAQETADAFAAEWVRAWNTRDLDAIMAHYTDDVTFQSPFVLKISGAPDGTVRGQVALREYFRAALEKFPSLCFTLYHAIPGVCSVALYYQSVNSLMCVEVMHFEEPPRGKASSLKAKHAVAHYKAPRGSE